MWQLVRNIVTSWRLSQRYQAKSQLANHDVLIISLKCYLHHVHIARFDPLGNTYLTKGKAAFPLNVGTTEGVIAAHAN